MPSYKRYDVFTSSRKPGVDFAENPEGEWVKFAEIMDLASGVQEDEQMQRFLEGVVGIVEATREEQHNIWMRRAKQAAKYNNEKDSTNNLDWVSSNSGLGPCIGYIASYPICITMYVNTIDGHKILFVEATSLVVHHGMIRDWLGIQLPGVPISDATNWTHSLPRKE